MSTLNLPACPICHARDRLSRQTRKLQGRTYTWYRCRKCASALMSIGGGRWAYQKVGLSSKSHLLQQPLTTGELQDLLPPFELPHDARPAQLGDRDRPDLQATEVEERASAHRVAGRDSGDSRNRNEQVPGFLLVVLVAVALIVVLGVAWIALRPLPWRTATPTAAMVMQMMETGQPTDTPGPPTDTSTPNPTATWVPTFTPIPPPPSRTPAPRLEDKLDVVQEKVVEIRGLMEIYPLTRTLVHSREWPGHLEEQFAKEHSPEELEVDVRVLSVFDFVPEDYDLETTLSALYLSQVIGFYDEKGDALLVNPALSEGEFDLFAQLVFVHEYDYGLLDEHFDLAVFLDGGRFNGDELLARKALVEGDATLVMGEYLQHQEVTENEMWELTSQDLRGSKEVLAVIPQFMLRTFEFPWRYGSMLVSTLRQDGWEAVDAAFADPPQSTEQLLHLDKYLSTRDEPQIVTLPPLTSTLGAGWHLVRSDTLGEFRTRLYLGQQLDWNTVESACAGWDGDRYAVYAQDGANLLVLATVWDSQKDREEFVQAYNQYAEKKYGQSSGDSDGAETWWETPDQTAMLTWNDRSALLILAPDPTTAGEVLNGLW